MDVFQFVAICTCVLAAVLDVLVKASPICTGAKMDITNSYGVRTEKVHGSRVQFSSLSPSLDKGSKLNIEFRTSSPSGFVFLASTGSRRSTMTDYVTVYLKDGHMYFAFKCNGMTGRLRERKQLDDGQWHKLNYNREDGTPGAIKINHESPYRRYQVSCPSFNTLFFGGLPPHLVRQVTSDLGLENEFGNNKAHRLEGCFRNVNIDNKQFRVEPSYHSVSTC
ncbi:laminin subunit alpha-3 [Lingula anatina]|uniref:Laminin subunit alpha-3 n=1 Tax=Lingula anatina TaxID=7574 RepID=A0A1S3HSP9_LINAN|nr:laminin subunit alpha-3 [Lingula anatina]|eukprot:XP_013389053.1 laminin subunit alpha-3 [Lingula anatina]